MPIQARDYQARAVSEARFKLARLRQQNKPQTIAIVGPTGSGKTATGGLIIEGAEEKGNKVAFLADRRELVKQTSKRLWQVDIPHGIIMAGYPRNAGAAVQVCSAQTLEKQGYWPQLKIVLVDECHDVRKATVEMIQKHDLVAIGLTATPFTDGLGTIYQDVVNVSTTNALIEQGWLVPLRVFCAKPIDMTGAKTTAGDWTRGEVGRRTMPLVGDIVKEWVSHTNRIFGRPVKTLVFTSTVDAGRELCREFADVGYRFEQVSYKSTEAERNRAIDAFERGRIHGLVSCDALSKGFDVPDVLCIVDARSTMSLTSEIQKLGRGMRPAPGKSFCLVLDHARNYLRHYDDIQEFFQNGVEELDDGTMKKERKKPDPKPSEEHKCVGCGMVLPPRAEFCPFCGRERPKPPPKSVVTPGKMEEIRPLTDVLGDLWPHVCYLAAKRHPSDHERAQRFAYVQYRSLTGQNVWGRRMVFGNECDPRVEKQVDKNIRDWLKKKRREEEAAQMAAAR